MIALLVAAACASAAGPANGVDEAPTPGCAQVVDARGDQVMLVADRPVDTASSLPPDGSIDIHEIAVRTTPAELVFHVKVAALATRPAYGVGHRLKLLLFEPPTPSKRLEIVASHYERQEIGMVRQGAAGAVPDGVTLRPEPALGFRPGNGQEWRVGGVRATYDVAASKIVVAADRAALAAASWPLTSGEQVDVSAELRTVAVVLATSENYAPVTRDEAPRFLYTIGDNRCFPPPPAELTALTVPTAQYGDAVTMSARLVDARSREPVPGARVTFAIGRVLTDATTGADGVARASVAHGQVAGEHSVAVTFAGTDSHGAARASGTLAVTAEKTTLAVVSVARSGSTRKVTVRLRDDDGTPVSSRKVEWWVDGKRTTTKLTDSAGRATYSATAGRVVSAKFAGDAGRYLAAATRSTRLT